MSKYTTELRYLIDSGYSIGLTDYPIFEESYRNTLNAKIISHFKFREIGFETPALFIDRLNERMSLIMPYYNQLYESAMLQFNPITTVKITDNTDRKHGETSDSHSTQNLAGNTTTNANRDETTDDVTNAKKNNTETGKNTETSSDNKGRKEVGSDTPQGLLSIGNIENQIYASTAAIGEETDSHNGTVDHNITTDETIDSSLNRTINAKEDSTGTISQDTVGTTKLSNNGWDNISKILEGYNGTTPSELLNQFRSTFLNIDLMVIQELEPLFMGIY